MTSGAPKAGWVKQFLEAKKEREAREKAEWESLTPEERKKKLEQIKAEKKERSRLW